MKAPCKMCENFTIQHSGCRIFTGCNDDEKKKGFHEDTFFYHHTCDNQTIREKCKKCIHNKGMYCNSVMAFEDEKCIDFADMGKESEG